MKSINQFYNKKKEELQSKLQKQDEKRFHSNKIQKLTIKSNFKVESYLPKNSALKPPLG
ncbi:hypothetical protein [Okeania sp. SIO3I5]|uniref:hypothetical protein n=1 Tax=Okeania sp. SIO3I5 TaxID=2607805 RepID=UPI0025E27ED6|nr:hypothetical protein [Okeania sp. SIO3I5]